MPGVRLSFSEEGEILTGGAARFLGYVKKGVLDVCAPGELHATGDLGYLDEAGCLRVSGRRDNMFVVGGENVQPERIENVLRNIEGIEEAVVTPVPDEEYGALPVAFLRGHPPMNEAELQAHLLQHLPKYMIPRRFLPWPETASEGMKLSRNLFREIAAKPSAQ